MNRQRFNYFFAVWPGRRREIDSLIIRILFKRQRNPKSCSFSGVAFNCDIAPVILNNTFANRKTQADALGFFGGKKRLKDLC